MGVYASANDLEARDYNLTDLLDFGLLRDPADAVWPAAHELLQQMTVADAWGASFAIIVLSVAGTLLTRRRRPIVTLLVTGLCLTSLLLDGAVTYIREVIASLPSLQLNQRRGARPGGPRLDEDRDVESDRPVIE